MLSNHSNEKVGDWLWQLCYLPRLWIYLSECVAFDQGCPQENVGNWRFRSCEWSSSHFYSPKLSLFVVWRVTSDLRAHVVGVGAVSSPPMRPIHNGAFNVSLSLGPGLCAGLLSMVLLQGRLLVSTRVGERETDTDFSLSLCVSIHQQGYQVFLILTHFMSNLPLQMLSWLIYRSFGSETSCRANSLV